MKEQGRQNLIESKLTEMESSNLQMKPKSGGEKKSVMKMQARNQEVDLQLTVKRSPERLMLNPKKRV